MVVSCCRYKIVPVTGHRTQRILKGITGSGSGQLPKRDQWIWLWADTARDNWMWQWADTERDNWIRQWAAQVPTNWRGGAQPLAAQYMYIPTQCCQRRDIACLDQAWPLLGSGKWSNQVQHFIYHSPNSFCCRGSHGVALVPRTSHIWSRGGCRQAAGKLPASGAPPSQPCQSAGLDLQPMCHIRIFQAVLTVLASRGTPWAEIRRSGINSQRSTTFRRRGWPS